MKIDITELKFFKENTKNLKINTPNGLIFIGDVIIKENKETLRILFSNGDIVCCSIDHLFLTEGKIWKQAHLIENELIETDDGLVSILEKEYNGINTVYDLEVLHEDHSYYSNSVVSHNTGKNAIALSAAMRLIDTARDKYTKIVYIRDTVISSENELGFLPGDLKDKMSGYMTPLYSTLEAIVKNKYNSKKRMKAEEIEEKISEMVEKYQIETPYIGFLRGTNIRDAVIIIDEFQNDTLSSARTIISRIAENCKLICIGSTKQIDSKFVNAKNNALTYLLNRISCDNQGVTISGFNLEKTVRSAMAEFGDNIR